MKYPFQGYLRIIAVFIRTIAALVIVAPKIQFMAGGNDHRLRCRIHSTRDRDAGIKGHRDADSELILYLAGGIIFGSQHHDAEIDVLPVLPDQ